jgi:nucleoside-diphosphate-sugar epimerase
VRVLVTGATGFIGRAVLSSLLVGPEFQVRAAVRRARDWLPSIDGVVIEDIGADTDWSAALSGIDALVHTAARAHVLRESAADPLAEFRRVNVTGTLALARQAAALGVRRFVFLSSVGVNGAETFDSPFSADDIARPQSPYAQSKYEAEMSLREISQQTGMQVVIIRPPLVYGPHAPGNFQRLVRCLLRGIPLPLASVRNLRSFIALDNLVDFIVTCLLHPRAANETFLVSDGEDLSTSELLRRMGGALGKPARLFAVPARLLKVAAILSGSKSIAQQLCGSLQLNIFKTRELLLWSPPIDVSEGLRRAALGYLADVDNTSARAV